MIELKLGNKICHQGLIIAFIDRRGNPEIKKNINFYEGKFAYQSILQKLQANSSFQEHSCFIQSPAEGLTLFLLILIYSLIYYLSQQNLIFLMNTKTKIIHKHRLTRSTRKIISPSLPLSPKNNKAYNYGKKPPKANKSNSRTPTHDHDSQNEDQNILVDLNLGKFGFDSQINLNAYTIIENSLSKSLHFSINPNIDQIQWKQLCSQMASRLQKQLYLICNKQAKQCFLYMAEEEKLVEISQYQYNIWQCMHELLSRMKEGSTSPGLRGVIQTQEESIRKIILRSKSSKQFSKIENNILLSTLYQEYEKQVAFHTFREGLKNQMIDEINYFLLKQYQQESRAPKQKLLENWQQWVQFISKKRPRSRKASRFQLHTACQLCLSPYSQSSNPIIKCSKCPKRGHRLCFGDEGVQRCGNCVYLRLGKQKRIEVPQCFICHQMHLTPSKINSYKFVHNFCMMAHGLWRIQNSGVTFEDKDTERHNEWGRCRYCKIQSKYYTKCEQCQSECHYMCAFLNGATFQIKQDGSSRLKCCTLVETERKQLGWQRKYILNYEKIVYEKLERKKIELRTQRKLQKKRSVEMKSNDHSS